MGRVTVVNYGMGNLLSVARAIEHAGAEAVVTDDPALVRDAEKLILPGVGAFADGMAELDARGLVGPVREHAASAKPLLGICLGMHLLMDESTEFGVHEGLGIVRGTVVEVPREAGGIVQKVPHIGWSPLRRAASANGSGWSHPLLAGIDEGETVYFVHSFAIQPADPYVCVAETMYGGYRIPAVIGAGPVMGTQFHPEKSGPVGLRLIRNFVES